MFLLFCFLFLFFFFCFCFYIITFRRHIPTPPQSTAHTPPHTLASQNVANAININTCIFRIRSWTGLQRPRSLPEIGTTEDLFVSTERDYVKTKTKEKKRKRKQQNSKNIKQKQHSLTHACTHAGRQHTHEQNKTKFMTQNQRYETKSRIELQ